MSLTEVEPRSVRVSLWSLFFGNKGVVESAGDDLIWARYLLTAEIGSSKNFKEHFTTLSFYFHFEAKI